MSTAKFCAPLITKLNTVSTNRKNSLFRRYILKSFFPLFPPFFGLAQRHNPHTKLEHRSAAAARVLLRTEVMASGSSLRLRQHRRRQLHTRDTEAMMQQKSLRSRNLC
jgi:hypothetical protein